MFFFFVFLVHLCGNFEIPIHQDERTPPVGVRCNTSFSFVIFCNPASQLWNVIVGKIVFHAGHLYDSYIRRLAHCMSCIQVIKQETSRLAPAATSNE